MVKRKVNLIISIVSVCIFVLFISNEKFVSVIDKYALLENRNPGYWKWLNQNAIEINSNSDGGDNVTVYPVSKMYLPSITSNDYELFLRLSKAENSIQNQHRKLLYFFDGTGYDIKKCAYGNIDLNSWTILDGITVNSIQDIKQESKPINEITDLYEYLDELQGHSFIISAMDDASSQWNEELTSLLNKLGLHGGFQYRDSYIAVVEEGIVISEQIGHEPLSYKNENIYVSSAGIDNGNYSNIKVDEVEYSKQGRGLNIVVLDNGEVIDSVNFDTYSQWLTCNR